MKEKKEDPYRKQVKATKKDHENIDTNISDRDKWNYIESIYELADVRRLRTAFSRMNYTDSIKKEFNLFYVKTVLMVQGKCKEFLS